MEDSKILKIMTGNVDNLWREAQQHDKTIPFVGGFSASKLVHVKKRLTESCLGLPLLHEFLHHRHSDGGTLPNR